MSQSKLIEEEQASALARFERLKQANAPQLQNYADENVELPPHLQVNTEDPSLRADLLSIARIEEEARQHQQEVLRNNRCSASEYVNKWSFLHVVFENSGCKDIHEFNKRRADLSTEYFQRFSPYHPIAIHDDHDPSNILVVIPEAMHTLNTIRGEAASAIDAFQAYGDHDRIDIRTNAHYGILQATADAQKVHVDDLQKKHVAVNEATIRVLRLFQPDHPLLKQLDGQEAELAEKDKAEKTKPAVPLDPSTVMVDDVNFDD